MGAALTEISSHPFGWFLDRLVDHPSFLQKRMFGSLGCYYEGLLVLVLSAQDEEPWNGVLVPTEKDQHVSLQAELPALIAHPVLGKWLYISEEAEQFESTVQAVVKLIARGDPRIGVIPEPRRKSKKAIGKVKPSKG